MYVDMLELIVYLKKFLFVSLSLGNGYSTQINYYTILPNEKSSKLLNSYGKALPGSQTPRMHEKKKTPHDLCFPIRYSSCSFCSHFPLTLLVLPHSVCSAPTIPKKKRTKRDGKIYCHFQKYTSFVRSFARFVHSFRLP